MRFYHTQNSGDVNCPRKTPRVHKRVELTGRTHPLPNSVISLLLTAFTAAEMFRGCIVFWHVLTNESPRTVALARCSEAVIFKGGCSVHVFTDCGAPARWRCSGKIIISERCIRQFLSMFAGCCFHEMISGCYMFCLHFAPPLCLCWLSRPLVNKLLKCRPVSTFTESYYGVNDI